MIEIDGTIGEGGGQILRTSLTLSSITKKPFKITNIRKKRENPGLQRQHLTAVEVVKRLTNAKVEGNFIGSTELAFEPNEIVESGDFAFDVGTAGSITLILQTILPLMLNRKISVKIKGGTDVPNAPTIDYIRLVFANVLKKIDITFDLKLIRRGHYPEGGGEIIISNVRGNPSSFSFLEFGEIERIIGISHVSSLPYHIAERQKKAALELLKELTEKIEIELEIREKEISKGTGICIVAIGSVGIMGSDSLGKLGKRAEEVGREASINLLNELKTKAAFDSHMGDMLMLYAALYKGEYTSSKLTSHAITNDKIIRKFLNIETKIIGDSPFLFKV